MTVTPTAAYDEIADWYERELLGEPEEQVAADPIGTYRALRTLLGTGPGLCVDLGCGTGIATTVLQALGWTPVGIDLSAGMLRYAKSRLPVVQGHTAHLPIATGSVAVVVAIMIHTDVADYPAAVAEVARILRPGGMLVHVGVHPCFVGGFADRSDTAAVVIRPGYLDGHWTRASWTDQGVRARVGATHLPLPALLQAFLDAGLVLDGFAEGGNVPVPATLALRARKPCNQLQPQTQLQLQAQLQDSVEA